jgi:hypothetical protein
MVTQQEAEEMAANIGAVCYMETSGAPYET